VTRSVIVSGARTPIGKFSGIFKAQSAQQLGALGLENAAELTDRGARTRDNHASRHVDSLS